MDPDQTSPSSKERRLLVAALAACGVLVIVVTVLITAAVVGGGSDEAVADSIASDETSTTVADLDGTPTTTPEQAEPATAPSDESAGPTTSTPSATPATSTPVTSTMPAPASVDEPGDDVAVPDTTRVAVPDPDADSEADAPPGAPEPDEPAEAPEPDTPGAHEADDAVEEVDEDFVFPTLPLVPTLDIPVGLLDAIPETITDSATPCERVEQFLAGAGASNDGVALLMHPSAWQGAVGGEDGSPLSFDDAIHRAIGSWYPIGYSGDSSCHWIPLDPSHGDHIGVAQINLGGVARFLGVRSFDGMWRVVTHHNGFRIELDREDQLPTFEWLARLEGTSWDGPRYDVQQALISIDGQPAVPLDIENGYRLVHRAWLSEGEHDIVVFAVSENGAMTTTRFDAVIG